MADEDPKPALDVPQVSISSNEASNLPAMPSTQQSQGHDTPQRDVVMADVPMDQASPAPAAFAPSPAPGRTGTPAHGSRAASAHPDPGFTMPSEPSLHGDSTRRYLNTKVTGVLLEGMKLLAKEKYVILARGSSTSFG
ncbi:histone-lysine n-methyltransferase [Trichoderma arundinaceum]|uniref:Histone-lysine n-methyltransferase n=1 Tax=Trichoderma arundinaceum TaxID=490622 RepID=A0A395NAC6_TRIAR|nr:histone-lysine n-methyltransferase [Trichoderma arundinaceum]